MTENKDQKIPDNNGIPLIVKGDYSNFAKINCSELQVIIDFGFVEPVKEGQQPMAGMFQRIVMPPKVAKALGELLLNEIKKGESSDKNEQTK